MTISSRTDLPDRVVPFVGGERMTHTSGETYEHRFAATGEVQGLVALAGPAEVDAAVRAATSGFRAWSALSPDARRDALLRLADLIEANGDELIALSIHDSAFPLTVAAHGPSRGAGGLRYFAGWADKIRGETVPVWPGRALDYTIFQPLGVVGIFATWNTPVYNLGLTIAPALAAGNAVLVKPSELAPYAYLRFAELAIEAGLPAGVVNVIPGGADAGRAMTEHEGVAKVHFTGGAATAHHVLEAAARSLKPVDLELGGKSANLVFPDCDLTTAVLSSMGAIIGGSGQTCITASRLLVHQSVYDEAIQVAVDIAEASKLGNPFDDSTTMGPLITAAAQTRVRSVIERAIDQGGKVRVGGPEAPAGLDPGYFVSPTVVSDVSPDSELFCQEVYGPVLAVTPFADEAQAIELANATTYGLAAYLSTNDLQRAHRVADRLQAGNVFINGRGGLPPGMPFGGVKESGFGRLGGEQGVQAFLQTKNVWVALPDA